MSAPGHLTQLPALDSICSVFVKTLQSLRPAVPFQGKPLDVEGDEAAIIAGAPCVFFAKGSGCSLRSSC